MSEVERNLTARGMFLDWLSDTVPGIFSEGDEVIWRGRARNYHGTYHPWYWIRICRWPQGAMTYKDVSIEVDCDNPSMKAWMNRHLQYIKGKLIWYCRCLWDMIDAGILDKKIFQGDEVDFDWDEDPEKWNRIFTGEGDEYC